MKAQHSSDPNDKSMDQRWNPQPPEPLMVRDKLRMATAAMGVVVIVTGAVLCVSLFIGIANVLTARTEGASMVDHWAATLGGDALVIQTLDGPFPVDRILAVSVLILGALILAMIALSLVRLGGRLVLHSLGEKEAVRKLLSYVFARDVVDKASRQS